MRRARMAPKATPNIPPIQNKQRFRFFPTRALPLAGTLLLTMAMTMPSCPGQQALQQQVDNLQASNVKLAQQVASLDSQLKALSAENTRLNQLVERTAQVVEAQKGALDQLSTSVKAIDEKVSV